LTDGQEEIERFTGGAMLYDGARCGQTPLAQWFEPSYWHALGAAEDNAGGRGTITFMRHGERRWVLRHYRRGGAIARLVRDRYFWIGERRTRAFGEWRLLHELAGRGLPVPAPVAARYLREGFAYTADLITEELPTRVTLAQAMLAGKLPPARWQDVGACIARFHAEGVHHADLNAHNVLLGRNHFVYLVDFDRGRIASRGASWEEAVLARLQRSLQKVSREDGHGAFGAQQWQWLREGYAR
jgi:3-deoxy-D-manno-octulosonic acid kinase